MIKCLILIKIGFDSLENHNPRYETIVGVFTDTDKLTAQGNAEKWFERLSPENKYTGYDGQIYPKYELRSITNLNGIA